MEQLLIDAGGLPSEKYVVTLATPQVSGYVVPYPSTISTGSQLLRIYFDKQNANEQDTT